ncbi:MAG: hypothetical protein KAJ17_14260 [Candidatus Krumholzibacteria bacterium]|nr:hypothetical protein [Candidatus Krumholzibacteria bacterium]MCK5620566.1 hypothetical protein [Candidatus Krumholzibacteria bacterium]
MNRSTFWASVLKTTVSLLLGGGCYSVWLAVFLLAVKSENSVAQGALFFLAPLVTAAGFAAGIAVFERRGRFNAPRAFAWPLIGCVVGSVSVYWYGPMLIVFTMLAGGTLSVIIREFIFFRKTRNRTK